MASSLLTKREDLKQPIQMHLSRKLKQIFLNFLLHFLNLHLTLNILKKKVEPLSVYISEVRSYRLQKNWLRNCLRSPITE